MADDSTVEETKQTVIQRFRAWGGKRTMNSLALSTNRREAMSQVTTR